MYKSYENQRTVSTLECPDLNCIRRTGNSTRQINFAIEMLFKGYAVKVRDHWDNGEEPVANRKLFNRIIARLKVEDNFDFHFREGRFDLIAVDFIIKINKVCK